MTWAFTDDDAPQDDRYESIGGAACWYSVAGEIYCRRKEAARRRSGARLDFIPELASLTLYGPPDEALEHRRRLLAVGIWEPAEGGYVIAGYERKYGTRPAADDDQQPPAADQQNQRRHQQRQLTDAQLEARRRGGQARAAASSRAGGRFQQRTSSGPAAGTSSGDLVISSGSGSAGSDTGNPKEDSNNQDLTGNQQPATPPAAVAGRKIPCPADLSLTEDQAKLLDERMSRGDQAALTRRFVLKAVADPSDCRTLVTWQKCLGAAINAEWSNPARRPPPGGFEEHQQRQQDDDARLLAQAKNGEWGAKAQKLAVAGELNMSKFKSWVRSGEARRIAPPAPAAGDVRNVLRGLEPKQETA